MPNDEARAQALSLFNEGRAKLGQPGKVNEACDLLTKSYDLDHRGDTLLNLAECHRRQGKTATAWREFDEAIRYAKEVEFTEAITAAEQLRDELAKHLSQLVVDVPPIPAAPPGLAIILDGKPLPKEQWGQILFVDAGLHAVTATADGYRTLEKSADVKLDADRALITVVLDKIPAPPPAPEKPKAPPPPPPKPKPKPEGHGSVPAWSVVVGGAGLVMMGLSVGFGVDTVNAHDELDKACGALRTACPATYDFSGPRAREVRSYGLFVGFGVAGIAATATGVVGLILGVTSKKTHDVAFAPWASPEGAGLAASGTFR